MRRWSISPAIIRDWLLLLGGMAGTGYETVAERLDRPWLLALFAGMMGLPGAIRAGRPDPPRSPTTGDGRSDTPPPS